MTEIARLMQAKKPGYPALINYEKKLNFLKRARKYYREVLGIELCPDEPTWNRLLALIEFRHALAHANGRLDLLREKKKDGIRRLITRFGGVDIHSGYVVFDKAFVAETTCIVISELKNLIERQRNACRSPRTV